MYLVVVAVRTPQWRVDAEELRRALRHSASATDRLEHIYLETDDGQATLSLYLKAIDRTDAAVLAEQLSRRTMATVSRSKHWRVESIHAL